ncbi:hypothetical protein CSK29544_03659 [Cronobacter sakazakii]|nr:hypothetical protein CSK29544_03659 [Cronobacter sakazakii]
MRFLCGWKVGALALTHPTAGFVGQVSGAHLPMQANGGCACASPLYGRFCRAGKRSAPANAGGRWVRLCLPTLRKICRAGKRSAPAVFLARYKSKKSRTCVQALSLNMAVREGLIRPVRPHPAGSQLAWLADCPPGCASGRTLVEASHPSRVGAI